MNRLLNYFSTLADQIGGGWNRLWFTPSDPLPAGVLRIVVGLIALGYVGSFTFDLADWMGPEGLLPVASVQPLIGAAPFAGRDAEPIVRPSLFNHVTELWQVWLLHLLCLAAVALFTAGFWTRITAWLALAATLMYIHRNPLITDQLEAVLVPALLYLAIARSGADLSLDRWLAGGDCWAPAPADWASGLGLRLLQVHVAAFHLLIALAMLSAGTQLHTWWVGEAVWVLIARTESRLVDLSGLRDSLFLINFWTHAIVFYMLAFPLLAWVKSARGLLLPIGAVVWLSIALITGLVPYALLMIGVSLAFVTAEEWRALGCDDEPASAPAAAT